MVQALCVNKRQENQELLLSSQVYSQGKIVLCKMKNMGFKKKSLDQMM